VVGSQREYQFLDSLKLGAIRLTSLFFLPGEENPVDPARYALLQQYVRNLAVRTLQQVRQHSIEVVYGSSGTIENLADIAVRRFYERERRREDVLTHQQLREVAEHLCSLTLEEKRAVPGINPSRADIIVAGAAILDTLLEALGLKEIRISDRGLRDGLLVDYLARSEQGPLLQEMSVRERSVLQLGRSCGFDEPHARTVARLALELFDSGREGHFHDLGAETRELLLYAALLHDVGIFLSYNNHQQQSYYLIRNADLLGFDQTEIEIIAATALFHRRYFPRPRKHAEFAALDKSSQRAVRVLAGLLRLAETLDRSHAGRIRSARLRRGSKKTMILELEPDGDCQLELWGVDSQKTTLERALGRELRVELKE
jgi:exopolyphosphatase/guanosine-5'-triphosphate,3'-diphosphate pyrophosphatase